MQAGRGRTARRRARAVRQRRNPPSRSRSAPLLRGRTAAAPPRAPRARPARQQWGVARPRCGAVRRRARVGDGRAAPSALLPPRPASLLCDTAAAAAAAGGRCFVTTRCCVCCRVCCCWDAWVFSLPSFANHTPHPALDGGLARCFFHPRPIAAGTDARRCSASLCVVVHASSAPRARARSGRDRGALPRRAVARRRAGQRRRRPPARRALDAARRRRAAVRRARRRPAGADRPVLARARPRPLLARALDRDSPRLR